MGSKIGLFIIISIFILTCFVILIAKKYKCGSYSVNVRIIPRSRIFLIFAIVFFLNGFLPHLGIKNIQVLAMYSNLKTEGGASNHFIIPSSLQFFDNLNDLVEIKRSNIKGLDKFSEPVTTRPLDCTINRFPDSYVEYLNERGIQSDNKFRYKIPFLQLQNIVTDLKDRGVNNIQLEYIRNGKYFNVKDAENDPDLASASIFQRKFLCLRAVPETSTGMCMW